VQVQELKALPSHYFSEEAQSRVRSKGLHLSSILESVEQTLAPRDYDSEGRDWEPYRKLGFVWEKALQAAYLQSAIDQGDLVDPGEVHKDGVAMSPDGLNLQGHLEEWKLTWKSSRRVETDGIDGAFPRWFWQMKSYCLGLGTNVAILRVFFVNGNYGWLKGKGDSGPEERSWKFTFTERELLDNWNMLINHAKKRKML
jgi:hypothetical protein